MLNRGRPDRDSRWRKRILSHTAIVSLRSQLTPILVREFVHLDDDQDFHQVLLSRERTRRWRLPNSFSLVRLQHGSSSVSDGPQ